MNAFVKKIVDEIGRWANGKFALASSMNNVASSISLSVDSSTYVITAQLKNFKGENLGTAQTIDLPLESVVVSGAYNNTTKKVELTLQNGSKVEFSVADLVSGLQSEITASNKLSVSLIDGLATVATSGSYNDLSDKPSIPSIEGLETSQHAEQTYQPKGNYLTEHQSLKTVNGESLVGEGNITISGGVDYQENFAINDTVYLGGATYNKSTSTVTFGDEASYDEETDTVTFNK